MTPIDIDWDLNWGQLSPQLKWIEPSIEVDWALNWSWFRPQLKLIEPSIEVDSDLNWGWLSLKLIESSIEVDSDPNWGWLRCQLKWIEPSVQVDLDLNWCWLRCQLKLTEPSIEVDRDFYWDLEWNFDWGFNWGWLRPWGVYFFIGPSRSWIDSPGTVGSCQEWWGAAWSELTIMHDIQLAITIVSFLITTVSYPHINPHPVQSCNHIILSEAQSHGPRIAPSKACLYIHYPNSS